MNETFHYNLAVIHSGFYRKVFARMLKECPELTPGQPKVIDYLMYNNRARQKEIALAYSIEPPTLTNILSRMELRGLVERKKDEKNRRAVIVCLTKRGFDYGIIIQRILREVEQEVLTAFSLEEAKRLFDYFQKIKNSLSQ